MTPHRHTPLTAAPSAGYGNIYTPHAGAMIIQVQRESGLQNRTIVLQPRQVRFLRFVMSRTGKTSLIAFALAVIALVAVLAIEAARVPILTFRMSQLEHSTMKLDTLEHSLATLQQHYDQVERMLGAKAVAGTTSAVSSVPPRVNRRETTSASSKSAVPDSQGKSSVPVE